MEMSPIWFPAGSPPRGLAGPPWFSRVQRRGPPRSPLGGAFPPAAGTSGMAGSSPSEPSASATQPCVHSAAASAACSALSVGGSGVVPELRMLQTSPSLGLSRLRSPRLVPTAAQGRRRPPLPLGWPGAALVGPCSPCASARCGKSAWHAGPLPDSPPKASSPTTTDPHRGPSKQRSARRPQSVRGCRDRMRNGGGHPCARHGAALAVGFARSWARARRCCGCCRLSSMLGRAPRGADSVRAAARSRPAARHEAGSATRG